MKIQRAEGPYLRLCFRKMSKGNIVNWNTATIETVNMTERIESVTSVCVPFRPGHIMLPMKRTFESHTAICNKLRGKVSVVNDQESQLWLNREIEKFPQCGNEIGKAQFLFAFAMVGHGEQ